MNKRLILILLFFISQRLIGQEFSTGCKFNTEKYGTTPQANPLTSRSFEGLPPSHSLKKYCPTPNNQSPQQSCVGWATTYAARTILESVARGRTNASLSAQEAFSPSYIYNQIKLDPNCNDGSFIPEALSLMYQKGNLKLRDFPYLCEKLPNYNDHAKASAYKIADAIRLTPSNFPFTVADKKQIKNLMRNALLANSPIVIGMQVYSSFTKFGNVWNGQQDEILGGHAMCIIGYDDNKYGGAFEIMNSWGSNWGDGGFIWVKYEDLLNNTPEIYQMIGNDRPLPEPKPQPKPVVIEPKPKPVEPKPQPKPVVVEPNPIIEPQPDMVGSIRLVKEDRQEITLIRGAGMRDFDIEEIEKPVYQSAKPIKTGDRFRIYFKAERGAYIYIISYGSVSKQAKAIYPFRNFSAYLTGGNSEVAIPNEDFYIKVDDKVGSDFLTFVYSLKPIDIETVCRNINTTEGSYISRMKKAFSGKILFSKDVDFTLPQAGFKAFTNDRTILPITIQFEHQ